MTTRWAGLVISLQSAYMTFETQSNFEMGVTMLYLVKTLHTYTHAQTAIMVFLELTISPAAVDPMLQQSLE